MTVNALSDNELISDLQSGKHQALTEIFKRYWKPLYLAAYSKLQSRELAEEIVQELFTELWDKRTKLFSRSGEEMHLFSYLNRAVKNKVLNHVRKLIYDRKYWEYCEVHLPSSESSTHELAEYNELHDKLNTALEQLSDKTKEIFVLHKLKGVPVVQISRALNLSEKAVGYHLTKSVKELKSHLRDYI